MLQSDKDSHFLLKKKIKMFLRIYLRTCLRIFQELHVRTFLRTSYNLSYFLFLKKIFVNPAPGLGFLLQCESEGFSALEHLITSKNYKSMFLPRNKN